MFCTINRVDPCSKCPLLKGKVSACEKPPCQDKNGLFLGLLMVSPFACETVIHVNKGQGD